MPTRASSPLGARRTQRQESGGSTNRSERGLAGFHCRHARQHHCHRACARTLPTSLPTVEKDTTEADAASDQTPVQPLSAILVRARRLHYVLLERYGGMASTRALARFHRFKSEEVCT